MKFKFLCVRERLVGWHRVQMIHQSCEGNEAHIVGGDDGAPGHRCIEPQVDDIIHSPASIHPHDTTPFFPRAFVLSIPALVATNDTAHLC